MSARVAYIACITQATLERIHHALLTHKRRLVFLDLNFIFDLPTCVNWAESALIFLLRSASCLRTTFADFWSLKGNTIQVIFVFLLFLGLVMYANEVETKEK